MGTLWDQEVTHEEHRIAWARRYELVVRLIVALKDPPLRRQIDAEQTPRRYILRISDLGNPSQTLCAKNHSREGTWPKMRFNWMSMRREALE